MQLPLDDLNLNKVSDIATSEKRINLMYNSVSFPAKKTLALHRSQDLPIWKIDKISTPLSGAQLLGAAGMLNMKIEHLVNQEHPYFMKKSVHLDFCDTNWPKKIEHKPQILKQSIAMRKDNILLVETPTDILQLLG